MAPKLTNIGAQDELRFITDTAPAHYAVRLEGFSLLAQNDVHRYETGDFEVGRYKWRLIIYPDGNKSRNGHGYISVYIAMADNSFNNQRKGINVVFKISILDQQYDKYYTVQVDNGRNFSKIKMEWGFDQLMTLNELNDPSNGYLEEDVCVIGAEVYIREHDICKAERLRMVSNNNYNSYTWKIDSFSNIARMYPFRDSTTFQAGDYKWKLQLHPSGFGPGKGTHLSIFLILAGHAILPLDTSIYAEYSISLIDQFNANHITYKTKYWFSTSDGANGWRSFVSIKYFNDPSKGLLVNGKCNIRAEVTILGVTTGL